MTTAVTAKPLVVRLRTARTVRHCDHCHCTIQPGTGYYVWRGRPYHTGCLLELSRAK